MASNAKSGNHTVASRRQNGDGKTKAKSAASIKREEKRDHIVRVSLRLFAKHGYDSTTIRMIAEEASMSLGLLYNYFDGKISVLEAICRRNLNDLDAVFQIPGEGAAAHRLEQLLEQVFHHAQKNPQVHKLFRSVRNQSAVQKLVGKDLRRFDKSVHKRLEVLLADLHTSWKQSAPKSKVLNKATPAPMEVDHSVDAYLLYASIDGVCAHCAAHPKGFPLQAVQQRLLERFSV